MEGMTADDVRGEIERLFPDAPVIHAGGDSYFMAREGQKMPFATLVTSDQHDGASDLGRAGIYRLNIGLRPETYRALFGPPPAPRPDWGVLDTGHDYRQLDVLMPHPVYAPMGWLCVLNPGAGTFEGLRPILQEAYALAKRRK